MREWWRLFEVRKSLPPQLYFSLTAKCQDISTSLWVQGSQQMKNEKSMLESSTTEVLIAPLNLWNSHYLGSLADACDSLGIQSAELWECLRRQNKAIISSTPGRIPHIIMRTGTMLAWGPHYVNWFRVPSNWFCTSQLFALLPPSSVSVSAGLVTLTFPVLQFFLEPEPGISYCQIRER